MAGGGSKKLDYQGRAFSDSDLQELPLKDVAYPYEEVNFSQNRLSAEGLRKVLELCSRCERLRILKLYKNDINDDAAQALSRFIRTCYSLEELHLSHNRFTERGVEMLVKAAQEARYEVDGGAPMWMRLEQNEVLNPDQVLGDLQHRYSVCSKRNRTKCSNRFCMHNCKVHLPHFHFQRDEYGHANNEGPRKRKWEAQETHPRPTEDPWKDTDWRDGRDDWFDGRPQVRNWEEDWEGPPSERPAGMKMSGGIFARAMGAIVRKDEDDGRGDVEPSKRRAVPKNVASRTLSQLGVLAEPRKSKVMLKEAPKGVKDEEEDEELEEEEEAQASEDKDEDEEEDDEEVEGEVEEERGRPSRGMAKAERRGPGQISRDRRDTERTEPLRAPTGRRQREHSRRHREEGRREAMHRRAPERETRETRDRRRGAEREREQREPREHRSRSRQRRHQRERSRERRRAEARDRGDRGERRKDRKDREGRNAERRNAEASPRRQERQTSERPRRRDERAAAGERTEKLLEKIQGSREKRESKATKQEPNDVNKAPPFVATRAKAAPRRPATTTAPPPRPKGTTGAGTAARVPAVAAPKVAAKAKAVADGNESEYTYTEASEYTYEDVEGEEEEEAVEVEDDEDDE